MTPSDFIEEMLRAQSKEELAAVYGKALKVCPKSGGWAGLNDAMMTRCLELAGWQLLKWPKEPAFEAAMYREKK